jgi:Aerobic-type carbon monoxide dehydrogenase, middle subunit CoxM/CutM homologs
MQKNYLNCADLQQALQALSSHAGKAKIIAGGTDLMLQLENGFHATSELLIDVSRIGGLDSIRRDPDGTIHLGPMVTHNHVVGSELLHRYTPLLVQACYGVGSPQIRNRGTVAGNLVTASPANDTISPLMALDAVLTLRSSERTRQVKLSDSYTGVRKTVLQPDEMVVDIAFKGLEANQCAVYKKYALRKAQAISLVNASIILTLEKGRVLDAKITLGAVAPVIIHSKRAEAFLLGKDLGEAVILQAAELTGEDVSPISDIRSSADYRKKISSILVKRGLTELMEKSPFLVPEKPVLLWGSHTPNQTKQNTDLREIKPGETIHTTVNGKQYSVAPVHEKSLLHFIREDIGLTGSKEGCGEGECGACTVFLDGVAVMSCLVPASRADGAEIVTIEGVSNGDELHPVQNAFIREGAVQCGYCTPGFVMSAVKLFEEKAKPDTDEIKMAITGNLCRCTGYYKIVKAIESVAQD